MRFLVLSIFLVASLPAQAETLNGYTEFVQKFALNVAVAGVVERLHVVTGQRVKAGDTLLQLESDIYQADLDRAQSIALSLQPRLQQMLSELDKAEELYDRDSLALIELKNAENNYREIEQQLNAANATVRIAAYRLQQTRLRTPVDGIIIAVNTHLKRYIDPAVSNESQVVLVNNRQMMAIASVNSALWEQNMVGRTVKINYKNRVFDGRVASLGFQRINNSSGLPGFLLKVLFEAKGGIPANMPVTIDIVE